MKLVKESVDDILKPKPSQKIVGDVAQEIELDLLSDAVSFFERIQYSPEAGDSKWVVSNTNWNINNAFDNYNKEFGPGYYVMSRLIEPNDYPMENLYPNSRIVAPGTVQYVIPQTEAHNLIKELVALVMAGQLGRGFHIKYFKPDETKNVQR